MDSPTPPPVTVPPDSSAVNIEHTPVPAAVIYRVSLSRALLSHYSSGERQHIAVQLATEFRDEHADLDILRQCSFDVTFHSFPSGKQVETAVLPLKISKGRYVLEATFPEVPGSYRMQIVGHCSSANDIIIPLESETFEVSSFIPAANNAMLGAHWKYGILDGSGPGPPSTQRTTRTITVREEFGCTLGSHVWDSAVVFIRHLHHCLLHCASQRRELAVELGAGCGLAGIALTGSFNKIVLTDKECNIPFMTKNISINGCEESVKVGTLDWTSPSDILRFRASNPGDIDMILAADVLYDLEAAGYLFDVIRQLATIGKTTVILGQKIRPTGRSEGSCADRRFDVTALADFKAEKILEEANVIIWKIIRIIC